MNVLYVVAQLGVGGQERQLVYLVKELLLNTTIEPHVFVWNLDKNEEFYKELEGLGVVIHGIESQSKLAKITQLRQVLKNQKIDIVHSYTFYLNFFTWLSAFGLSTKPLGGLRTIFSYGKKNQSRLSGILNTLFPKNTVVNNHTGSKELKKYLFGLKRNHVWTISNKLDFTRIKYRELQEKNTDFVSVSMGSIIPLKRLDIIIHVIEELVQNGFSIVHYHAGIGSEFESIERLISEKKLNKHFILTGKVMDVDRFLSKADVFLHASDIEGTPNVIMEAMASGRPVITTEFGDAAYLVRDGKNGFVVPKGDAKQMLVRTMEVLSDWPLRKKFSHSSHEIANQEFRIELLLQESLKLYSKFSSSKYDLVV